jgi:hypothetical protein
MATSESDEWTEDNDVALDLNSTAEHYARRPNRTRLSDCTKASFVISV